MCTIADGAPPTSFDHSWFCRSQSLLSHGKSLFVGARLPTEVDTIPVSFKLGYANAVIDAVVETALALTLWWVLKYERFLLRQPSPLSPSTWFHLRLSLLHLKVGVIIIIAVVNVVVIRLAVVRWLPINLFWATLIENRGWSCPRSWRRGLKLLWLGCRWGRGLEVPRLRLYCVNSPLAKSSVHLTGFVLNLCVIIFLS